MMKAVKLVDDCVPLLKDVFTEIFPYDLPASFVYF